MIKTIVLALAAAASSPQQFDLNCTFTGRQPKGSPLGEHYRFDLVTGQWCLGDCTEVKKIIEITPVKLVLENDEPPYENGPKHLHQIDRVTGELFRVDRFEIGPPSSADTFITEGTCTPALFSGFPKVETKF